MEAFKLSPVIGTIYSVVFVDNHFLAPENDSDNDRRVKR
jgi:hypothetical protein